MLKQDSHNKYAKWQSTSLRLEQALEVDSNA